MKKTRKLAIAVLPLLIAACGGGSDPVVDSDPARPYVIAGFALLNQEGEAGEGGTGDGDGGIGAGGSLGAFTNVQFTVTGDNGQPFGSVEVPSGSAVTVFPPLNYTGTIKVEIAGSSTSEYFDESLSSNALTGTGSILRAVVRGNTKRIGVTPLTTAAANLLDNRVTAGTAQADNPSDIDEANRRVQQEINRFLPADNQVSDITTLPVLTNSTTSLSGLNGTAEGRYAQVLAALAVSAKNFNSSLTRPALSFLQNVNRDIEDGTIDNSDKDGNAIAPPGELAYDATKLSINLNTALQEVTTPEPTGIGRTPSASVCIEQMTDTSSFPYRLLRIDVRAGISTCQYDFNNGAAVSPALGFLYNNEIFETLDISQCSAPGEFRIVTTENGSRFQSTTRLVQSSMANIFAQDLGIEALRRAVNEGVGAPCP